MTYSRRGDKVTLTLSFDECQRLLVMLYVARNGFKPGCLAWSELDRLLEQFHHAAQHDLALYALLPPDPDSVP